MQLMGYAALPTSQRDWLLCPLRQFARRLQALGWRDASYALTMHDTRAESER